MPKFYVPVVLVVNAEDETQAFHRADDLTDGLLQLKPEHLDGVLHDPHFNVSPASTDWEDHDTFIVNEGGYIYVKE